LSSVFSNFLFIFGWSFIYRSKLMADPTENEWIWWCSWFCAPFQATLLIFCQIPFSFFSYIFDMLLFIMIWELGDLASKVSSLNIDQCMLIDWSMDSGCVCKCQGWAWAFLSGIVIHMDSNKSLACACGIFVEINAVNVGLSECVC